jgi:hypothetical protein
MRRRAKKPKEIKVALIDREDKDIKGRPYEILDRLVAANHPHLAEAKVVLGWHLGWKADADRHVKLGRAKKVSDLDHLLHGFDFIILLNRVIWHMPEWTDKEMTALLDHELCHCQVRKDKNGDEMKDERGRLIYRIRKHDVEEFQEIMSRHGAWKGDLEVFVKKALERRKQPLLSKSA